MCLCDNLFVCGSLAAAVLRLLRAHFIQVAAEGNRRRRKRKREGALKAGRKSERKRERRKVRMREHMQC